MSEAKRSYLKRLGYSDERIRKLEASEAKATKDKRQVGLEDLVFKQLASDSPAPLSDNARRIVTLVVFSSTKRKEQAPGQPNIWDLIAPPAGSEPTFLPYLNEMIARSQRTI